MDLSDLDGRKIKVANKTYRIRLRSSIRQGRLLGESNHYREVIKLSTRQSPGALADTLLHEILHCIWYSNGIGYVLDADEVEEFVVNSYATSLMAVFVDNPWLIDFFRKIVKKGL